MIPKIFLWTSFLIFSISISPGCFYYEDNLDREKNENPSNNQNESKLNSESFVLSISSKKTTYHASNNCTIPIDVDLKNNYNRSFFLDEISLRLSSLDINVTNSKGMIVATFMGVCDCVPQGVLINPHSNISSHIIIGGPGWDGKGDNIRNPYYFDTKGEFTFQAFYKSWPGNLNGNESVKLTSNQITIKIL